MKPGDLVACRDGARLRKHPAGARYDYSDEAYWRSEIEVDEVALVLDRRADPRGGATDLYVLGPRGPGWIWEDSVQIVRKTT